MGRIIRALFWTATALLFTYNLYLWGGLALTPTVGKTLREQSSIQGPIAATYLFLGRHAVSLAGKNDASREFAGRRFASEIADPGSRVVILDRFLAAQNAFGQLAYYGAPLLLLLSMVLHARRQRQITSFGGKR